MDVSSLKDESNVDNDELLVLLLTLMGFSNDPGSAVSAFADVLAGAVAFPPELLASLLANSFVFAIALARSAVLAETLAKTFAFPPELLGAADIADILAGSADFPILAGAAAVFAFPLLVGTAAEVDVDELEVVEPVAVCPVVSADVPEVTVAEVDVEEAVEPPVIAACP